MLWRIYLFDLNIWLILSWKLRLSKLSSPLYPNLQFSDVKIQYIRPNSYIWRGGNWQRRLSTPDRISAAMVTLSWCRQYCCCSSMCGWTEGQTQQCRSQTTAITFRTSHKRQTPVRPLLRIDGPDFLIRVVVVAVIIFFGIKCDERGVNRFFIVFLGCLSLWPCVVSF